MFKDKTILIIGATGTLGTETIRQLRNYDIHAIRAYARNEHKMWQLRQQFGEENMRYFIGDICNKDRLDMAFTGADIVINYAAIKHVKMCNENPFMALQTNVIGVQNALECAVKHNIDLFMQMSTDKAVNPINIYGCTKAMAEHLTLQAKEWQGDNRTRFLVVRSGNVIGSSGSVIETWAKQKEQGLPLTVTDMEAERYMAEKEKIVSAILNTVQRNLNGLVVLSLPKHKIKDLLKQFKPCKTQIIGLQEGEKQAEELWREGEKFHLVEVI